MYARRSLKMATDFPEVCHHPERWASTLTRRIRQLDDDFGAPTSAGADAGNFSSFEDRFPDVGGGGGGSKDFERSAAAFPSLENDDFLDGAVQSPGAPAVSAPLSSGPRPQPGASFVTSFERERPFDGRNVAVTGNDDLSAFENQFPEIATAPPALPKQVRLPRCIPWQACVNVTSEWVRLLVLLSTTARFSIC